MRKLSLPFSGIGFLRGRERLVLLAVGSVYVAFGILVALIQGGLPPVLRAKGLSVAQASLVFLLYLPFGLSFLWAPLIDRFHPPVLSRRTGWIVIMQGVVVAGLAVVAVSENGSVLLLAAAGFAIAMAAATMDLALDAMTVEMAGEPIRPVASGLKLAGLSLGAVVGGGVVVGVLRSIGWEATFLLVALATILATSPVFLLVADDLRRPAPRERSGNAFAVFVRRRRMPLRLTALIVTAAIVFPLTMLNRMMLIDLGMPLERVGWIVGTVQPVCLLVASIVTGPIAARAGPLPSLFFLSAAGISALLLMLLGVTCLSIALATVGAIAIAIVVGALFVLLGAHILDWAQGEQVATDYAIMFNSSRLTGAVAAMAAGGTVHALGWKAFYAGGAIAFVLVMLFLGVIIRDPEPEHRPSS